MAGQEVVQCSACQQPMLRPYDQEMGGFVLHPGDRTRTRTPANTGCCGFKHIYALDDQGLPDIPVLGKSPEYDYQPIHVTL